METRGKRREIDEFESPPSSSTKRRRLVMPTQKNKRAGNKTSPKATKKKKAPPAAASAPPPDTPLVISDGSATKSSSTKVKKERAKNFTAQEDYLLCKAYVNASTNPIVGTDQKGKNFWDKVEQNFNELFKQEKVEEPYERTSRDRDALQNRFNRHIQKAMNQFAPFMKRILEAPPSGSSPDDYVKMAKNDYRDHYQSEFSFENCYDVLQQLPKFQPMYDEKEEVVVEVDDHTDDGDKKPAAINRIGAPMGAGLQRPIGAKRAKKIYKDETSVSLKKQQDTLDTIADSQVKMERHQQELNTTVRMQAMFSMFMARNQVDRADSVMQQLEGMMNRDIANKSPSTLSEHYPQEIGVGVAESKVEEEDGSASVDEVIEQILQSGNGSTPV